MVEEHPERVEPSLGLIGLVDDEILEPTGTALRAFAGEIPRRIPDQARFENLDDRGGDGVARSGLRQFTFVLGVQTHSFIFERGYGFKRGAVVGFGGGPSP